MIEIKTRLRRWGNSFGVVLPMKAIENEKVSEGEEVVILMKRKKNNVLRETFGTLRFRKSTDQMMREIDEEIYDD
ncbi:hypothetical protein HYV50_03035 [Candidatus Pacearchaeota archaeon]|nr:hypothetical protein [Candidatus Pacearchaeota archaeon]